MALGAKVHFYKDGFIHSKVVLVDGETASSAELFAESLRQFSGAQLVGQKTYGKGTILSLIHI